MQAAFRPNFGAFTETLGCQVITAVVKRQGKKHYTCNLTAIGNGASPANLPHNEQCLSVLEKAVENYAKQWYQWKKFGAMIKPQLEIEPDRLTAGYLPYIGLPIPDQA